MEDQRSLEQLEKVKINEKGQTQAFGGRGGSQSEFNAFKQNKNLRLVGVQGRTGDNIDQLKFIFRDELTKELIETPEYGGYGGSYVGFTAPQGQWITQIQIGGSGSSLLQSLVLHSQTQQSRPIGRRRGNAKLLDARQMRIVGVRVRHGGLIDGLQFILQK